MFDLLIGRREPSLPVVRTVAVVDRRGLLGRARRPVTGAVNVENGMVR